MFKVYKKLLCYVPKLRWLAVFAILLTVLSTFITVFAYYYMSEYLWELVVNSNLTVSYEFAIRIVLLLVLSTLIYIVAVQLTHILGFRLETNFKKKGIEALLDASFKFFDKNPSGKVRKIIDDNAQETHSIVAHLIPDNAGAVLTPILVLILGFVIDLKVGIALSVMTVIGIISVCLMAGDKEFMVMYQASLEKMNSETVEFVRGIQVVKIFDSSIDSFKVLHKTIMDYSKYALNYCYSCRPAYVLFQVVFFGLMGFVIPLIVLFMDYSTNSPSLVVNLIMLLFLTGLLFSSFMKVMYVAMYAYQGSAAVEKLEALFSEMAKEKIKFSTLQNFKNYNIEFDNVSFSYDKEVVLDHLSFKLEQNKSYALVGSSGSGKSTIVKLLSGFYSVNEGKIKIGGKAIQEYSQKAIIENIAFVFQDSKLFKMSIFDNVKIANPKASDKAVFEALSNAWCDSIIDKFPDREKTIIGSKGVFLSGGEKQKIAIARAMLKNAKIIIMDEASAAVDPENEHELQKAFKNLIKNKTVIMIAHRLSSISAVDEILVMEKGKLIERGTNAELMEQNSRYRDFQKLYSQANDWRLCDEKSI